MDHQDLFLARHMIDMRPCVNHFKDKKREDKERGFDGDRLRETVKKNADRYDPEERTHGLSNRCAGRYFTCRKRKGEFHFRVYSFFLPERKKKD